MGNVYKQDVIKSMKEDAATGYCSNGHYNKYAEELDKCNYYNYPKNGVCDHCSIAVDYHIYINTIPAKSKYDALRVMCEPQSAGANAGAGCTQKVQYFKNANRWIDGKNTKDVATGDEAFFKNSNGWYHTGVVVDWDADGLYIYEANTAGKGLTQIKFYTYSQAQSKIGGYGRPQYDGDERPKTENVKEPEQTAETQQNEQQAANNKRYTVRTSGDALRIRENATTDSKQVGYIPNTRVIESLEVVSGEFIGGCNVWVKTNFNGVTGYVSGKYLQPTPEIKSKVEETKKEEPATEPEPEKKEEPAEDVFYTYKVKTNSGVALRIREEPTTDSAQIGYIDNGATVRGKAPVNNWVYVEHNGVKGYAYGNYLKKQ